MTLKKTINPTPGYKRPVEIHGPAGDLLQTLDIDYKHLDRDAYKAFWEKVRTGGFKDDTEILLEIVVACDAFEGPPTRALFEELCAPLVSAPGQIINAWKISHEDARVKN